jgi:t-SNARE complex subunit (syntaxin)
MTSDFDTAVAYAASGGVRHGRYFVLSIHFILITMILSIVYIITLFVDFYRRRCCGMMKLY